MLVRHASPLLLLLASPVVLAGACSSETSTPAPTFDSGTPTLDAGTHDTDVPDVETADTAPTVDAGPNRYDVTVDFPTSTNPAGVWSLGWAAKMGDPLTLYTVKVEGPSQSPSWEDPVVVSLHAPNAWKNLSTGTVSGNPAGFVAFHPGPDAQFSVIRFTAPIAATYTAAIKLFAGDSGETVASVVVNGAATSLGVTSLEPTYNVPPTALAVGQTIDVWLGTTDTFYYDTTPITFTVDRQ